MLISTVDVIFADVAQPDQARIVIHNAQYFLKDGGHVVISIKASCVDSTIAPSAVFSQEVQTLRASKLKPIAQVTLEPYERDHAMVTGKQGVLSGLWMIIDSVCSSVPSPPVGWWVWGPDLAQFYDSFVVKKMLLFIQMFSDIVLLGLEHFSAIKAVVLRSSSDMGSVQKVPRVTLTSDRASNA